MPRIFSVISAVLLLATAFAWEPHGEITQAALDAMGPNDPLVRHLGPYTRRLTQDVWMTDLRQTLLVRGSDFLAVLAKTVHS